jgi:hypothetical protein
MASKKRERFLDRLKNAVKFNKATKEVNISKKWFAAQLQDFSVYSQKRSPDDVFNDKKRIASSQSGKSILGSMTMDGGDDGPDSLIGQMVMYYYSPKHADTLPFYDTFPLGIIVGPVGDNKIASLNLHYLPNVLRASFLDNLLDVLTTESITKQSRFEITYAMLKGISKYKYFAPCYKHYLTTHIKSNVKIISPDYWIRSVFLDTAQFKKASKGEVYKWSRSKL